MRRSVIILMTGMLSAVVLCGCGSSYKSDAPAMDAGYVTADESYYDGNSYDNYSEMAAYDEEYVEKRDVDTSTTENGATSNRKLIRTASLDVETKQYDEMIVNLENKIKTLGGYIENMNNYNGSIYADRQSRSSNITARIPAAKLDEFIGSVGEVANITRRSESVQDVTLNYVDMDSHKKMLQEEEDRLLEFLDKAETIEEIITLEERLTTVKYQLESMESQLRTYDNQIDYSTVNINISEVVDYTEIPDPEPELTPLQRMSKGFMSSLRSVGIGIREFFISFVISIPYLLVIAVFGLIVFLIVRLIIIRSDRKLKNMPSKISPKTDNGTEAGISEVSDNE